MLVTEDILQGLRKQLAEVEAKRAAKDLDATERELLALSAVALRDAERIAMADAQKALVTALAAQCEPLKKLTKEIREKVEKMARVPKTLDIIEQALAYVARVMSAIAIW